MLITGGEIPQKKIILILGVLHNVLTEVRTELQIINNFPV